MKRIKRDEQRIEDQAKIRALISIACPFLKISEEDFYNGPQKRSITTPRQMVYHYLLENGFKSQDIGDVMDKDHSTILYGQGVISELLGVELYKDLRETFVGLTEELNQTKDAKEECMHD